MGLVLMVSVIVFVCCMVGLVYYYEQERQQAQINQNIIDEIGALRTRLGDNN